MVISKGRSHGQYGGGTVQLWDRGYWAPAAAIAAKGLREAGELKFVLQGERLHGGWVLVRCAPIATAASAQLAADQASRPGRRSGAGRRPAARIARCASGRSMAQIAAGKGRAPKPFMRRGRPLGRRGVAIEPAAAPALRPQQRPHPCAPEPRKAAPANPAMPRFIDPQLAKLVERPPGRGRLGPRGEVRRLPAADAGRGRIGALCAPARASTGPRSSPRSPRPATELPTPSSTARGWRSTTTARRISRRCRRRSRPADRAAGLLRVRPAVRRRPGPAPAAAGRPQGAAEGAAGP